MINLPDNLFKKIYSTREFLESCDIKRTILETKPYKNNNYKFIVSKNKVIVILDKQTSISVDVYNYENNTFNHIKSYYEEL